MSIISNNLDQKLNINLIDIIISYSTTYLLWDKVYKSIDEINLYLKSINIVHTSCIQKFNENYYTFYMYYDNFLGTHYIKKLLI